ncbi:Serine/arginine-rich splicing factor 10 [Prunus yedoensis var. nudiflora]|uniref:Serine/arginine-rich splicing factor 10 n=1 Tax=Prunus yedoensis var. nudiflora TaxID=2094558 RepID=A0A314ZRL2_PRUYE|nr:Serine/arginine-rich splicing factor 10 [Prunus yedoensis var. nudiflora]
MRGRSYSYSPSPPRGYSRGRRSPSPRGRYGGRGRDLPSSLLVRNLRHNCRCEESWFEYIEKKLKSGLSVHEDVKKVGVSHMIEDSLPLVILDHRDMLEPTLEVLITIPHLLGGGGTQGQFHRGTQGTGSNHAQGLPMVQGAVAAALVGAGVKGWTTLSSGTL